MAALRDRGLAIAALVMMIVLSGCSSSGASSQSFGSGQALTGTAWIAEDLGGRGVLDHPQTTMSFPQAGQVGGSGGCNHYGGPVEVSGEAIRFGPLASTSIACSPAIGDQEKRFFAALRSATRFVVTAEDKLVLYDATGEAVVTFIRAEHDRHASGGARANSDSDQQDGTRSPQRMLAAAKKSGAEAPLSTPLLEPPWRQRIHLQLRHSPGCLVLIAKQPPIRKNDTHPPYGRMVVNLVAPICNPDNVRAKELCV